MIRLDAVRHVLDAIDQNAALFMTRELEALEAEIYRFKERELVYRALIPVSNRDNPGCRSDHLPHVWRRGHGQGDHRLLPGPAPCRCLRQKASPRPYAPWAFPWATTIRRSGPP